MVRTPGFHPGNRGSIPLSATNYGGCNSVGECLPCTEEVAGSNPVSSTNITITIEDGNTTAHRLAR